MQGQEHIAAEDLVDYVEQRADEETMTRVRAHLDAGCASCAEELAFWTRLLAALRAGRTGELSEETVERAVAIFDRTTDNRCAPKPSWWERMASPQRPPVLMGAHGSPPSFQRLFTAGSTDIDLLCERKESGWCVTGQALSMNAFQGEWTVSAISATRCVATQTDAQGEFRLAPLAPGVYALVLRGTRRTILLPNVSLGEAAA